ncbi:MAG: hypothetical protein IKN53_04050, partial [Oscillibacter sp.]|nr:hypothetical protein [Oscillibacter sp.]
MEWYRTLTVDTADLPKGEPLYEKLFPLVKSRVEERCGAQVVREGGAFTLVLRLDRALTGEAYAIGRGEDRAVISGADFNALVFGLGRFLHGSQYGAEGVAPCAWSGVTAPRASVRAVYFAMHFFNWYQRCEPEEIERYVEDLMLWGINAVTVIFPKINLSGWDDPNTEKAFVLMKKIFTAAKKMNMKTGFQSSNQDFDPPNPAVAADKSKLLIKSGNLICPATEAGYTYLRGMILPVLRELAPIGVDYMSFWSYDEGGCSCEKCWPWGANGQYNYAKRMSAEIRKELPNIQVIYSTWLYERASNQAGEWDAFYRRVKEDEANGEGWIDLILVETRDHPSCKYVLEHGSPCERIRLVTFPDVAMMGQEPWGGLGGLVAPHQVRAEQTAYSAVTDGCFMYSEGKYEDMNKILCASVLWDADITDRETITDYCHYEFPGADASTFCRLIDLIERNHDRTNKFARLPADMDAAEEACRLAAEIDGQILPACRGSWRWRILYIRVFLDRIRFRNCAAAGWPYERYTSEYRFAFWGDFMEH